MCNIQGLYTFSKKPGDEKRISKKEEDKARSDYDFALNGIDAQGFPYNIWQKLSRRVLKEADSSLFQLGNPCGEQGFRQAIADYLYRPEEFIVVQSRFSLVPGTGSFNASWDHFRQK